MLFEVFTAVKIEFVISGLLHHVMCWLDTKILEDHAISVFRVELRVEQHSTPKCSYPTTALHGATTQKTMNSN
jgi:hypothetical protein